MVSCRLMWARLDKRSPVWFMSAHFLPNRFICKSNLFRSLWNNTLLFPQSHIQIPNPMFILWANVFQSIRIIVLWNLLKEAISKTLYHNRPNIWPKHNVTRSVPYSLLEVHLIIKCHLPAPLFTRSIIFSVDTESEHITLSLLEKDTGCPDLVPSKYRGRKRKQDSSKNVPSKNKRRKISEDVTDSGVESDSSVDVSIVMLALQGHSFC